MSDDGVVLSFSGVPLEDAIGRMCAAVGALVEAEEAMSRSGTGKTYLETREAVEIARSACDEIRKALERDFDLNVLGGIATTERKKK